MNRQRRERKQRDQRPYIRDVAVRRPRSLAEISTVTIGMVALALGTGFLVGFAVFVLMGLSSWLTGLVWNDALNTADAPWFPLVVCTLGGLIIGLWTHFSGNRINGLEEVLAEFKTTGRYDLNGAGKTVVSFLLPLVFGGPVGFEAGLTGIITAGCCWIRDRLKAAGLRVGAIADVSIAASLSAIFGTPLAGIVAGAESMPHEQLGDEESDALPHAEKDAGNSRDADTEPPRGVDAYDMRRGVKVVLYLAAAVGAFGGIALFSELFGASSGLPRFDAIQAAGTSLLWALPCLAVAYVLTLLYHASDRAFSLLANRIEATPFGTVIAPVVAGIVLGLMATAFPYVLFPGEEQSHLLMGEWQTWTAVALIATGLLKAIATPMSIRMGWMGGAFFPSIFAGVACGYGLAALTGADPMLMVTVITSAYLAGMTRKPLMALAILALCFPLTGILWSGLAVVIGAALPIPRVLQED